MTRGPPEGKTPGDVKKNESGRNNPANRKVIGNLLEKIAATREASPKGGKVRGESYGGEYPPSPRGPQEIKGRKERTSRFFLGGGLTRGNGRNNRYLHDKYKIKTRAKKKKKGGRSASAAF